MLEKQRLADKRDEQMRVAFRGNFRPRTAAGEPFSTESHVSATMELLGHTVFRIQEDVTPWCDVPFLVIAAAFDVLWFTTTWRTDFEGGYKALAELHAAGLPTASHSLDLFVGLEREHLLDTDPFWRTKYVFTADGGHQEVFAAKGINHHWAPPGVFAPECYLAEPDPGLVQDLAFVGSLGYHKEYQHRSQLIEWLQKTYGPRFRHYDHGSQMRGHRLNQLYASARVLVGDSCLLNGQEFYSSDRIPETTGRGGFLLHPWVKGVTDGTLYVDGEHLVTWPLGDWDALRTLIDYYLTHDAERERIRRAGHKHVKAYHSYTHRVQAMLEIIGKGEGWT